MLTFDETITVYNSIYNHGTGFHDYFRTIIRNCSWYGKNSADGQTGGLTENKLFKVRILEGFSISEKVYVSFDRYVDTSTQYTLAPGTIILKGVGPPAPTSASELAALTAGRTDVFKVLDARDNRRIGIKHLYAEGK